MYMQTDEFHKTDTCMDCKGKGGMRIQLIQVHEGMREGGTHACTGGGGGALYIKPRIAYCCASVV